MCCIGVAYDVDDFEDDVERTVSDWWLEQLTRDNAGVQSVASRGEVEVTEVKVESGALVFTLDRVHVIFFRPDPKVSSWGGGLCRRCVKPVVLGGKQHHPNPRF